MVTATTSPATATATPRATATRRPATVTVTSRPPSTDPLTASRSLKVEANQGTAVFIGEGGEWVAGEDRLAPLVRDRDTLIRVHYDVNPAWQTREIEARLILEFADGTSKTLTQTRMVDGPSQANALSEIFYFGLVGESGQVSPDMSFKVELHEVADGAGASLPEAVWQTPPEPEFLGIQPEPLELRVVFVPYHHIYQNIDRLPDTSDANMQVIADALYEQNAVTDLIWELHEPVDWALPMDNLGSVLGPMSALRDNELAAPNVYYHAIFPVPNGGVAGVAGVASVPGDGKGEGDARVSVSALGNNINSTAGTVVHEVGHTEGMQHVFCPFANAASPDPTYPTANGLLGQWGFGIISFSLHGPDNTYDYMSYCNPSWVSTWSWTKTFNRIRTLTAWEYEDAGGFDFQLGPMGYAEKDLLIGSINADGTEFWWTTHGTLPSGADPYGDEYDHQVELRQEGGVVDVLPSVVRYTNDYSTAWLISELPAELATLDSIDEIVRIDDENQLHPVVRAQVQISARSKSSFARRDPSTAVVLARYPGGMTSRVSVPWLWGVGSVLCLAGSLTGCKGDDATGNSGDSETGVTTADGTMSNGETADAAGTEDTGSGTDTDMVCADDELECGGDCCAAGEVCFEGSCADDCGGAPACGSEGLCCEGSEVCYLGACVVPDGDCSGFSCATKLEESTCAPGYTCDADLSLCVPTQADPNCMYVPPPSEFAPRPEFTWGTRAQVACMDESVCQTGEVCMGGFCTVTWPHIAPEDAPENVHVSSIPVVADLDGDCIPEIIFNSYIAATITSDGMLRAIRGDTGAKLWTITDPLYASDSAANPAIGDID